MIYTETSFMISYMMYQKGLSIYPACCVHLKVGYTENICLSLSGEQQKMEAYFDIYSSYETLRALYLHFKQILP